MTPGKKGPKSSAIDLLILGMLIDRPQSAYDLASFVESKHLNMVLKVSAPAIYKNCKRLHADQLLEASVSRSGDLPEKVTYRINDKGRAHFYQLMAHYSQEMRPFHFEHNSFLWNLEKMPKEEGLVMLSHLQTSLVALKNWISAHEKEVEKMGAFGPLALARQYRMVFQALVRWIKSVIKDYQTLK